MSIVGIGGNSHGELGTGTKTPGASTAVSASVLDGYDVQQFGNGYYFTVALLKDGTCIAFGGSNQGELGNGVNAEGKQPESQTPVKVLNLANVVAISTGGAHWIALLADGRVAVCGGNSFGTIGNGTFSKMEGVGATSPVTLDPSVFGGHRIVSVFAEAANTYAVDETGQAWAWGENKSGQCGDGTVQLMKTVPTKVVGLPGPVREIVAGGITTLSCHTIFVMADGSLWACGGNGKGQLGDGTLENRPAPVRCTSLVGVTEVAAGVSHSCALVAGEVFTWGNNGFGELGRLDGALVGPVALPGPCSALSAGFRYTIAIVEGNAYGWGWDHYDEFGGAKSEAVVTPQLVPGVEDAISVEAGEYHTMFLQAGSGPPSVLTITPGPGSLRVSWLAPATTEHWNVSERKWSSAPKAAFSKPVGGAGGLPPATRSFTFSGLISGAKYEISVASHARSAAVSPVFKRQVIAGTPL